VRSSVLAWWFECAALFDAPLAPGFMVAVMVGFSVC
jgi:hypothetical protein